MPGYAKNTSVGEQLKQYIEARREQSPSMVEDGTPVETEIGRAHQWIRELKYRLDDLRAAAAHRPTDGLQAYHQPDLSHQVERLQQALNRVTEACQTVISRVKP